MVSGLAPKAAVKFLPVARRARLRPHLRVQRGGRPGEATVINDSYAHNEAVEPVQVRIAYDRSAMAAAAMGVTIFPSSGDSAQLDTPARARS